jgi:hypothetical protein
MKHRTHHTTTIMIGKTTISCLFSVAIELINATPAITEIKAKNCCQPEIALVAAAIAYIIKYAINLLV